MAPDESVGTIFRWTQSDPVLSSYATAEQGGKKQNSYEIKTNFLIRMTDILRSDLGCFKDKKLQIYESFPILINFNNISR